MSDETTRTSVKGVLQGFGSTAVRYLGSGKSNATLIARLDILKGKEGEMPIVQAIACTTGGRDRGVRDSDDERGLEHKRYK